MDINKPEKKYKEQFLRPPTPTKVSKILSIFKLKLNLKKIVQNN